MIFTEYIMNIRGLLKHRNALYGLLAIWIVCFHVSISVRFPTSSYTISHFIKATLKQSDVPFNGLLKLFSQFLSSGNLAVDVFMLLSGVCLYLSFERRYGDGKIEFFSYFKKRISRVVVPYLVIALPYWAWVSVIRAKHSFFDFPRFIWNYSSASFWFGNSRKAWFAIAIMLFYLLFPLIFKLVKKHTALGFVMLAVIYVGGYFLCKSPAENISIAVTRLPSFVIGAMLAKHIDALDLKRLPEAVRGIVVFLSFIAVLLGTAFFPIHSVAKKNSLPHYAVWYTYGLLAVCFIIVMVWICGKVERFYCEKTLSFIGSLSLEIYLVHTMTLGVMGYYHVDKKFGVLLFPMMLAWGILGGYLASLATKLILKPFEHKKALKH